MADNLDDFNFGTECSTGVRECSSWSRVVLFHVLSDEMIAYEIEGLSEEDQYRQQDREENTISRQDVSVAREVNHSD